MMDDSKFGKGSSRMRKSGTILQSQAGFKIRQGVKSKFLEPIKRMGKTMIGTE